MTKEQAQLIVEAFEIDQLLGDDEEVQNLKEHAPKQLQAYRALLAFAEGVEDP